MVEASALLFNSIDFLVFFPIAVLAYFLTPHRFRWIVLLVASYYFYMSWKAEYIVLIIASTLVDYFAGLGMGKYKKKNVRKLLLGFSLLTNLGILVAFKYLNFFSESLRNILSSISLDLTIPALNLLLPVGISFYTFQTLSYTIDVYNKKINPEKHLGIFAVYVSFFPQLVAGPIERAKHLLPQFFEKHNFNYEKAVSGLRRMLWGFFKKVVIADRLAIVVNQVYNNPSEGTGLTFLIATIFFAYQIYCDFSGYSDIAIGAARILGFDLMENFKRPYFSKNISEFWKRWHISLSSWFRDYVYIPLGGNRVGIPRWYANLFLTFLISGLWHGANWTFVVWGGLHGLYLVLSIITKKFREGFNKIIGFTKVPKIHTLYRIFGTFILANLTWIFFRANSVGDGFYILKQIFMNTQFSLAQISSLELGITGIAFSFGLIIFLEIIQYFQEKNIFETFFPKNSGILIRWGSYLALIMMILLLGVFTTTEFIYFQF